MGAQQQGRQALIVGPGEVRVEPAAVPEPGPGQALLELEVSLPSPGTELAVYGGYHQWLHDPDHPWSYPFTPGYAAVGTVAAVGPDTPGVRPGQRMFAAAPHRTHALVRVAERGPLPVPERADPEHAVFAGLARFSLGAVMMARPTAGRTVVVQGLGVIGQLALRLFRAAGAYPLVGVDPVAFRRELAEAGGADLTLDAGDGPAALRERIGKGADIVADATGAPAAVPQAMELAADGGQVVIVGSPRGQVDRIDFYPLHNRCLEVVGAHGSFWSKARERHLPMTEREALSMLLAWLAGGRISTAELISRRADLSELQSVYHNLRDDLDTHLAALITYGR